MLVINLLQCTGIFLIVVQVQSIICQKTRENYRTALFARPETVQKAEALYQVVSQNISIPTDKAVENILKWLQSRYQQINRIARQETLANMRSPNYTMRPQPFSVTLSPYDPQTGYPYNTYPTPEFNSYDKTNQYSSPAPNTQFQQFSPIITQNTQLQYTPPSSNAPVQYPTSGSVSPSQYSPSSGANSRRFHTTSTELPYTYVLPDSQNPDFEENTDSNVILAHSQTSLTDYSTTPTLLVNDSPSTFAPDENTINQLETASPHQLPHVHIDVQCSKDRMEINVEFDEVYNGIIYSKGFYNDPNCHFVKKNSGQEKYSFVVMLNTCGTQFVDEFFKGKQAFLENVLVLQNEPLIQEVWDVIRSVRCLWEGSIKQTLSAGLNVDTLNQDVLTFSGDMIAARLEIQIGNGPNAPSANGLVKIGDTMTLVVTVDGDAAFNVLVRSCTATDGNPNSGNVIQLTDDQGCVLKPKLFGNFHMLKNPDPSRPSVVAYAYFKAFKFPDVMDLLVQCNVELCKSQCQICNQSLNLELIRHKRLVNNQHHTYNATKFLSEKLHIVSPDEMKFISALGSRDIYQENENQICISETTFYLQYAIILTFFCSSVITMFSFWIRLKRLSDKSRLYY